ncbi:ASCH domain-containing protein [Candidatus Saccharibacteria bacterium]|nr:ASCH domain-containing protein [Candidatus Saccharibacteria bacterium]
MKTHEMNLQPKYFDFMKNGTKRVELRLYDEKRSQIELGDIIEFSKSENDILKAEVIGLLRYNSFKDLFEDFDISILADASMTKVELLNTLSEFYTPEKQAEYGVIGIRLKILQEQ